jgi:hypothetical protein
MRSAIEFGKGNGIGIGMGIGISRSGIFIPEGMGSAPNPGRSPTFKPSLLKTGRGMCCHPVSHLS